MSPDIDVADVAVSDAAIERAAAVLESGRYVKGPEVAAFEREFADLCGTDHAVAVGSGTAAISLALQSAGVEAGDRVFVPGMTFFATASPVLDLGADPVVVDVDERSHTMDPDALATAAAETDDAIAVLPVHLYGHPARMDEIRAVADDHDLLVIEDACQAHGARRGDTRAGAFGHAGCFSFYPTKNLTVAGDGGMLVTDDDALADRARALRNHGRTPDGTHAHLGLNHRLSEVAAAVGREGLERLPEWNERRRELARAYDARLDDLDPVETPTAVGDVDHVYHLYVIRVDADVRDRLRDHLAERGIDTGVHYETALHRHPAIEARLESTPDCPRAEALAAEAITLPMHPRLSTDDVETVCAAVEAFYR